MTAKPLPTPDPVTRAYWNRLREGHLAFQECMACRARWLPPSPACPRCWRSEHRLVDCSGHARLLTWAVYHHAYHPAFAELLPYAVGLVELEEGPRLFSGIRAADPAILTQGTPLVLVLESQKGGLRVPAFAAIRKEGEPQDGD